MAKLNKTPNKAYDKIIKENLEAILLPLAEFLLEIQIQSTKKLAVNLQTTLEREPDFIREVKTPSEERFILHLEFQRNDEAHMVYRMKEYEAILSRKYRIPIKQFVVYLGEGASKMVSILREQEVFRGFELLNFSSMDVEKLLEAEVPEAIILAILADFDREKPQEILQRILARLKSVSQNENQLKKYLIQLQQLSRLRNLTEETNKFIEEMPITYDFKEDYLYKKGQEEAKRDQQNHVIVNGFKKGVSNELLSDLTGLSLEEVEARIKELGLA